MKRPFNWPAHSAALGAVIALGCGGTTVSGGPESDSGVMPDSAHEAGLSCSDFLPAPNLPKTGVVIRLVNKTGINLYLGSTTLGCGSSKPFSIEDNTGTPLEPFMSACGATCAALQKDCVACADDCATPLVTLLPPGAAYATNWQRTVFLTKNMPASCYKQSGCEQPCVVETAAPQALTIRSSAWTSVGNCSAGETCTCSPDTTGTCSIPGIHSVGGAGTEATTAWTGQDTLDLVFTSPKK